MRLTIERGQAFALELLAQTAASGCVEQGLADQIAASVDDGVQADVEAQRARVATLKEQCEKASCDEAKRLITLADYLVKKSVWIVGGDGWAYDIGYGGLDHVLASGKNVNVLVMDTEVYSNTGGQMSKATPRAAVAKFAAAGKKLPKKDFGLISMSYGNIFVAKTALGANPSQTVKAFMEAEAYDGPSIIFAYTHCIAQGINMSTGVQEQKNAVACGHWPLYRYDPRLKEEGKNPLQMDSKAPTMEFSEYAYKENRYRVLQKAKPELAAKLMEQATQDAKNGYDTLDKLSKM
jgi:pyruvate-ferredoxin/flavodoxin oxidoreductase